MSLLQNITKESDTLRQRHYTTKRLWLVDFTNIFWFILKLFLLDILFLLVLSILTLESVHSIRFLYQHFLSGITTKSLNTFYHVCSYAKVDYSHFMNITAKVALRMIPDSLATQPIFLCVDDTMVAKAGTRFENVSKLFDHAAHNGSNYLNGHCFVSIMLCIPVWKNDRMKYIPLFLYSFRWNIETSYYEQKTFWSLCRYMVRSCKGIECW